MHERNRHGGNRARMIDVGRGSGRRISSGAHEH